MGLVRYLSVSVSWMDTLMLLKMSELMLDDSYQQLLL